MGGENTQNKHFHVHVTILASPDLPAPPKEQTFKSNYWVYWGQVESHFELWGFFLKTRHLYQVLVLNTVYLVLRGILILSSIFRPWGVWGVLQSRTWL